MSQSLEQELNELRSLIAQSASVAAPKVVKDLEKRLASLEERIAQSADPQEAKRQAVLKAVASADGGKPGHLSIPQIMDMHQWTKSEAHNAINSLAKKNRVWLRRGWGDNGRPVDFVYDLRALRP